MKIRVSIDDQSFEVEVGDLQSRPVSVMVDGEQFDVWPEETAASAAPVDAHTLTAAPAVKKAPAIGGAQLPAAAAPKAGAGTAVSGTGTVIAPIPGVIISIAVKEGDTVSVGQDLLILEAMKMKNNIRANRAGKIAAVRVAPGDLVKRGQVMLEFGD